MPNIMTSRGEVFDKWFEEFLMSEALRRPSDTEIEKEWLQEKIDDTLASFSKLSIIVKTIETDFCIA